MLANKVPSNFDLKYYRQLDGRRTSKTKLKICKVVFNSKSLEEIEVLALEKSKICTFVTRRLISHD